MNSSEKEIIEIDVKNDLKAAALIAAGVPREIVSAHWAERRRSHGDVLGERDRLDALMQAYGLKADAKADSLRTSQETQVKPQGTVQHHAVAALVAPAPDPSTLEAVRAELEACADPVRKAELARKARELRGHGDLIAAMEPTAPGAGQAADGPFGPRQAIVLPKAGAPANNQPPATEGPFGPRRATVLPKPEPAKVEGSSRYAQERAENNAEVARLRRDLDQTKDPRERANISRRIRDLR